MDRISQHRYESREIHLEVDATRLGAVLTLPRAAQGMVVFIHGSGSSRHSLRNQRVARELQEGGLATLLFDLLTADEEQIDMRTRHLRFDIDLLARRTIGATEWLQQQPYGQELQIGYFGASTGAAAALIAAAERPHLVRAVVSRGGRPDLAAAALPRLQAPTLLIVGGQDHPVFEMNQGALAQMPPDTQKRLALVPGATHLFEEPGALGQVARLARDWFQQYLSPEEPPPEQPQAA